MMKFPVGCQYFSVAVTLSVLSIFQAGESLAQMNPVPNVHTPNQWPGELEKRIKKVKKYDMTIVFTNDSVAHVRTNVERIQGAFLMTIGKDDEMIIVKPHQTKSVHRNMGGGKKMSGITVGNKWLFKTNDGPIFTYSLFPDENSAFIDIIAVQEDNGPIVQLTKDSLKAMIEPTSKAFRQLEKDEFELAITTYNYENRRTRKIN